MALTRMPTPDMWVQSHCVKLLIAAFAALYAGIFVSGLNAFMDEMLMTVPPPLSAISRQKT